MDYKLVKKQLSHAYRFSHVRMALNYYGYFDTITENTIVPEVIKNYSDRLNDIIEKYYCGDRNISAVDSLRNDIMSDMTAITSFTDCFNKFEYALNRVEGRYITESKKNTYDDRKVTDDIIEFLLEDKNSVVMNNRIKGIISQLPIRYTNNKFREIICNAMTVYNNADRESLNNMIYTLRSLAMLDLPETKMKKFCDIYSVLQYMRQINFKEMDADTYKKATDLIAKVSQELGTYCDLYIEIQDIINDMYVLVLSHKDAVADVSEEELIDDIIKETLHAWKVSDSYDLKDVITHKLRAIEGLQERYYEAYIKNEVEVSSNNISEEDILLIKVQRLLSGSHFADIQKISIGQIEKVDASYINEECINFCCDMEKSCKSLEKPVVRAVMADVISCLPIWFTKIQDIEEYIFNSLSSCTDIYEKTTSIELIYNLMENDNALV